MSVILACQVCNELKVRRSVIKKSLFVLESAEATQTCQQHRDAGKTGILHPIFAAMMQQGTFSGHGVSVCPHVGLVPFYWRGRAQRAASCSAVRDSVPFMQGQIWFSSNNLQNLLLHLLIMTQFCVSRILLFYSHFPDVRVVAVSCFSRWFFLQLHMILLIMMKVSHRSIKLGDLMIFF